MSETPNSRAIAKNRGHDENRETAKEIAAADWFDLPHGDSAVIDAAQLDRGNACRYGIGRVSGSADC